MRTINSNHPETRTMWKATFSDGRPSVTAKTKRALLDEIGVWSAKKSHRDGVNYIVHGGGGDPDIDITKVN